jgi:hypothetical protein
VFSVLLQFHFDPLALFRHSSIISSKARGVNQLTTGPGQAP